MRMILCFSYLCVFFFKQKTAYEMRISDWSSDVCSSDLQPGIDHHPNHGVAVVDEGEGRHRAGNDAEMGHQPVGAAERHPAGADRLAQRLQVDRPEIGRASGRERVCQYAYISVAAGSLKKKPHIHKRESQDPYVYN